jgi:hypothetical protein
MRRVVLLLLVACPLFAKPFDVEADLSRLTDAQREWLLTFEAGARLHANVEIPSSDWLRASASSARKVDLGETANVLDAAADVLTNRRATFPATWDSPVYVMPFVIEGRLTDVVVAIPTLRFEHSDRARIATLQFRAGASAASTAVDSKFGTMSIVYDNMAGAVWFSARVLPVAEALMPSAAMHVNADALIRWYAFRAFTDDGLETLVADSLATLPDGGSARLLNFALERGALRFDNDQWTIDLPKLRDAVRETTAITAIPDLACYSEMTPPLQRTVALIAALPKTTIEPRYALPSPDAVVRSYFAATTREDALAHLVGEYRKGVSKALKWDFALHPSHRIESIETRGDTAIVNDLETNDFARLLDFPGWHATTTFRVFEGRIVSSNYAPAPNQPRWQTYLEIALPWLRANRARMLAHAYPNESLNREAAAEWVSMLRDWRAATGRPEK